MTTEHVATGQTTDGQTGNGHGAAEAKDGRLPAYMSFSTLNTFTDWIKEMTVVPSRIDRSLWAPKFAGGVASALMPGLRFLGLLDGERPTDTLKELATADSAKRKELMRAVLRRAYGDRLIDDLPHMTPSMLNQAIKNLGTTDATHRKAVSFFINAAKAVDLNVPPAIAKKARNKTSNRTGGRGRRPSNGAKTGTKGQEGNQTPEPKRRESSPQPTTIEDLRTEYIKLLMKGVQDDGGKSAPDLLDRIELLLGFQHRIAQYEQRSTVEDEDEYELEEE